ncbi:MAG: YlmC/YmxH family sporulation protein [Clostridia bacterium]
MTIKFSDLKKKVAVDIKTGIILGKLCDVEFDGKTGAVYNFIISKKLRFFGLFGKENWMKIKLEDIEVIGDDAILINQQLQNKK